MSLEIRRDNILDTLEDMFSDEVRIVVLEGEEGIGKTTVLRQLAARHEARSVSFFLSAASRYSYDPSVMLEAYCEQMARLTPTSQHPSVDLPLGRRYQYFVQALSRRARADGEDYYFILDGLEEIPGEDRGTRDELLAEVPLSTPGLRCLLSSHDGSYPFTAPARKRLKSFPLPTVTREEGERLLAGLGLDEEVARALAAEARGAPGVLASIRRLIEQGTPAESVQAELHQRVPNLFALEWRSVGDDGERQLLLALLSRESRAYSLDALAAISGLEPAQVEPLLHPLRFLARDAQGEFRFVSDSMRRAASAELSALRTRADDLVLAYLQRDPDSPESLSALPSFFESTDRLGDLVRYLTSERLANLLKRSPSLAQVRLRAERAAQAARRLDRRNDFVRLSLQQSTIAHLSESSVRAAALRAQTSIGDADGAIAVAEQAVRPAERLRLLVAVARTKRELGQGYDGPLHERIAQTYAEIPAEDMPGEDTAELAADLFHTHPDLSIDLVSRSTAPQRDDDALDWALARLAVNAQIDGGDDATARARDLGQRIHDPAAKRLSTEATMLLGGLSAAEAIAEAQRLDRVGDQIYVLRHWMLANAARPDALDVLGHALQLALKTRSYQPNAQVFRELATCLPYVQSLQPLHYWIATFDAQRAAIDASGPAEESVRLQLLIARSLWRFDKHAASDRYVAAFDAIAAIEDPASRVASLGRLLTSLRRVDTPRSLDESLGLHQLTEDELKLRLAELLDVTADQLVSVRPLLIALASSSPDLAFSVAERLNTEWRRDGAYEEVAGAMSKATPEDLTRLTECLARIVDGDTRERATVRALLAVLRQATPETAPEIIELASDAVHALTDAGNRARVAADYCVAEALTADGDRRAQLRNTAEMSLEQIDSDWERLEVGYDVIASVARRDPEFAKVIVDRLNLVSERLGLLDEETTTAAVLGLQLATRAYAGLVARGTFSPSDRQRLRTTVERVGSVFVQASLWADLAERLWTHGKSDACAEVVADHLMPLLEISQNSDLALQRRLLTRAFPAVWVGMRGAADGLLARLGPAERESALEQAAWLVLRNVALSEPYETAAGAGYELTWSRALDLMVLLRRMEDDSRIFSIANGIVASMRSSRYGDAFKSMQRDQMALDLERLASEKLPSAHRFIRHDGYAIAVLAVSTRLRSDRSVAEDILRKLEKRARAIPNVSDRAYVMIIVAQAHRDAKARTQLADDAAATADSLPLLFERSERLQTLSGVIEPVDAVRGRVLLQRALQATAGVSDRNVARRQRAIVEELYRRDPKTAPSVASILSSESERRSLADHDSLTILKESLSPRRPRGELPRARRPTDWPRVIWDHLGELNAGRVVPLPVERTLEYLPHAAQLPVLRGYPIFAWAIENAVRHNGQDARQFLVPLFEASMAGAELALHAASRLDALPARLAPKSSVAEKVAVASVLIRDGERHVGLGLIRDWLHKIRPTQLRIVDPYFTPGSLEAVLLVQEAVPECDILVLTSKQVHRRVAAPYEDTYRSEWARLSAQEPPRVHITLAGTVPGEKCPVHDRWWLTETVGLKLGTSLNGIGGRWSEIDHLDEATTLLRVSETATLFTQTLRQFEGEVLKFSTVTL